MPPAFIRSATDHVPKTTITFDNPPAHASQAIDQMRRTEQRTDPALKGVLGLAQGQKQTLPRPGPRLDRLVVQFTAKRTARAWLYRERLRDILDRNTTLWSSASATSVR
jgi:hypothetical protein